MSYTTQFLLQQEERFAYQMQQQFDFDMQYAERQSIYQDIAEAENDDTLPYFEVVKIRRRDYLLAFMEVGSVTPNLIARLGVIEGIDLARKMTDNIIHFVINNKIDESKLDDIVKALLLPY